MLPTCTGLCTSCGPPHWLPANTCTAGHSASTNLTVGYNDHGHSNTLSQRYAHSQTLSNLTPPVLLPPPPNPSGHKWKGQGSNDPNDSPHKQAQNQDTKNNYLPKPLFDIKCSILQHLTRVSLACVLKEGGTDIQTLMWTTGVPYQTCCRYVFWGACAEPTCHLNHDPIKLTPEQVAKAMALLQPRITKLSATQQESA